MGLIEYNNINFPANYFEIACRYNSDSVKILLNNKNINLSEVISNIYNKNDYKFNCIKLALLYQPYALKYILESKYCTRNLIIETNLLINDGCLFEALNNQIASYSILYNSDYISDLTYHTIHGDINIKYKEIINNYDINLDKLLKIPDSPTDINDNELCSICYNNKYKIIFSPCSHKSCVTCAVKLYKCHQCRTIIKNKLIYNKN